jgi:hypothetical protein
MKYILAVILFATAFITFAAPAYQFALFVYSDQQVVTTISQQQIPIQDDRCFYQCQAHKYPFIQCKQMCSF